MKKLLLLIALTGCISLVTAQQRPMQERVHVGTGDTLNYVLSNGFQYLYPNFIQGRVFFDTGEASTAYLNYNILLNEIHFLENQHIENMDMETENDFLDHAQSLVLDDIEFIVIGKDVFVNTPRGIMFLVANYDIQLLQYNKITQTGTKKTGAYGQEVQSASIESRDRLPSDFQRHSDLKPMLMTEYSRKSEYFLYEDGKLTPTSRRQFERAFPALKEDIRTFVSDNNTNFDDMEDLKTLLQFCAEKSSQ